MNTKKGEMIRDHLEKVRYELSLGCTCHGCGYSKEKTDSCTICQTANQ